MCSAVSGTAWINDWCSRPQVKVREVHYWIISGLLSFLPYAWLLLFDVVELLEGTLYLCETWTCVCSVCVHARARCAAWGCMLLVWKEFCTISNRHTRWWSQSVRVDNKSHHQCFRPVFVSSGFILMSIRSVRAACCWIGHPSLWFCFAVSEANRLCWTQGELIHSTDHALWSTSSLWEHIQPY